MRIASVAVAALLAAAPLAAQSTSNPQTRQGFTIAFGLGAGSAGISCDGCDDERETGVSGFLRLGGAIRPNLVISGQTRGFRKEEDGVTSTAGFLFAAAQLYPQPATGFYLEGGLGFGTLTISDAVDELTSGGLAMTLGTGYDVRVGKNFSLTPFVNFMTTFGAEGKVNGISANEKLNTNVLQLGLGFTWH